MRFTALIILALVTSLAGPAVIFVMLTAYIVLWRGWEVLLVAGMLDAFFNTGMHVPMYTLYAGAALTFTLWIRSRMLIYPS